MIIIYLQSGLNTRNGCSEADDVDTTKIKRLLDIMHTSTAKPSRLPCRMNFGNTQAHTRAHTHTHHTPSCSKQERASRCPRISQAQFFHVNLSRDPDSQPPTRLTRWIHLGRLRLPSVPARGSELPGLAIWRTRGFRGVSGGKKTTPETDTPIFQASKVFPASRGFQLQTSGVSVAPVPKHAPVDSPAAARDRDRRLVGILAGPSPLAVRLEAGEVRVLRKKGLRAHGLQSGVGGDIWWVKNMYPKWKTGKWKHGPTPAVRFLILFLPPYPYATTKRGHSRKGLYLFPWVSRVVWG